MHHSRVYALLIDTPAAEAAPAAAFWSAALGATARPEPQEPQLCVIPVHSDPGAFKAQATTWP
jgi:hypothetical protein